MLSVFAVAAPAFAPLPSEGLVYYNTTQSLPLLMDALQGTTAKAFLAMTSYVPTQATQTFCSIATSVSILNALTMQEVDKRPVTETYAPYPYFTQQDFVNSPCVTNVTSDVDHCGTTLSQLNAILKCIDPSRTISKYHASTASLDEFRRKAVDALSGLGGVAINFDRKSLGQPGGGHWSPLGAYAAASDAFLLLDVAKYKLPYAWVKALPAKRRPHRSQARHPRRLTGGCDGPLRSDEHDGQQREHVARLHHHCVIVTGVLPHGSDSRMRFSPLHGSTPHWTKNWLGLQKQRISVVLHPRQLQSRLSLPVAGAGECTELSKCLAVLAGVA